MPISAKWKHKSSIHIGFIVFNGGVATFFAKSVWYHTCKAKRMYQLSKLFWRNPVQDSNIVVGDTGATHADLMEAVQSFICVLIGMHSQSLTTTINM